LPASKPVAAEPEPEADLEAAPQPRDAVTVPAAGQPLPKPAAPLQPAGAPASRSSREIFIELGRDLQRQRERLGISLAEVERHTHLRTFTLQALEEGRMEDMPSMVQARGMLANYARFLNLDGEALLMRFADALQARREELAALELVEKQPKPARRAAPKVVSAQPFKRVLSIDVFATAGLVVLLVIFVIWGAGHVLSLRAEGGVTPTAPSVSDILLAPTRAAQAGLAATTAASPSPAQTAISGEVTDQPLPTVLPTVQMSLPAGVDNLVAINLVASQRAWVQVTADNKVVFTGRLVPGNAYPFSGARQVNILTGNAGGFQVYFNNNDLGVVGSEGEVLNLVFTAQGMQKAAPVIPTSATTPTPTKAATSTPSIKSTSTPGK
jgi:cytoskeletal protein RodZ